MAARKSTNISLIILGVVSLGVVGYFVWVFLAPPPPVSVVSSTIPTDIETGVVSGSGFQSLRPYANLPVKATNVGRLNPFSPYAVNASELSGVSSGEGGPKAPLINSPAPAESQPEAPANVPGS